MRNSHLCSFALNDWIFELDEETKVAEAKEKVVRQKYFDAVSDAQTRLHK